MFLRNEMFRRLCRARDLLQEEHDRPLSIEAIAHEARISPFHFIRVFEAVFGLTPHQFRTQARLDRARHLLAVGELSVTEVCMEVGFSSLGSFSDLFSRRVGMAPSAYQRRLRPMIQVPGEVPAALIPGCLSLMAFLPASAASQFSRSIGSVDLSHSNRLREDDEAAHENQAHEHHGR